MLRHKCRRSRLESKIVRIDRIMDYYTLTSNSSGGSVSRIKLDVIKIGRDDARHQSHGAHLRDLSCFLDISLHMALMSFEFGRPSPFTQPSCHASHLDGQVGSLALLCNRVTCCSQQFYRNRGIFYSAMTRACVTWKINNFQSTFL